MRSVRWDARLWFPDGVPANLLAQALEQVRGATNFQPKPVR